MMTGVILSPSLLWAAAAVTLALTTLVWSHAADIHPWWIWFYWINPLSYAQQGEWEPSQRPVQSSMLTNRTNHISRLFPFSRAGCRIARRLCGVVVRIC